MSTDPTIACENCTQVSQRFLSVCVSNFIHENALLYNNVAKLFDGEGAASAKREAHDAQILTCSRPGSQTFA